VERESRNGPLPVGFPGDRPDAGRGGGRQGAALPALLLEACGHPRTRQAAAVAERVEGDPARITAIVHEQVDELLAFGLLRPCAAAADRTVSGMRLLLGDEPPPRAGARGLVGMLSRAVRPAREHAEGALRAAEASYPIHRLDATVAHLDRLLAAARLRGAFSTELDGYWAGPNVHARVRSLEPLLEVLRGPGIEEESVRAVKEWALSVEALERFARGEPLARVHRCVFAALGVKVGSPS
jgi:hypothetical protein